MLIRQKNYFVEAIKLTIIFKSSFDIEDVEHRPSVSSPTKEFQVRNPFRSLELHGECGNRYDLSKFTAVFSIQKMWEYYSPILQIILYFKEYSRPWSWNGQEVRQNIWYFWRNHANFTYQRHETYSISFRQRFRSFHQPTRNKTNLIHSVGLMLCDHCFSPENRISRCENSPLYVDFNGRSTLERRTLCCNPHFYIRKNQKSINHFTLKKSHI